MAAYEDWIPLDPEIFKKLDSCDPSFSWELLKNEVCKARLALFHMDSSFPEINMRSNPERTYLVIYRYRYLFWMKHTAGNRLLLYAKAKELCV